MLVVSATLAHFPDRDSQILFPPPNHDGAPELETAFLITTRVLRPRVPMSVSNADLYPFCGFNRIRVAV